VGTMVVGLFPNHDTIESLTNSLKGAGFHVERLRVISSETPSDHLIGTGVQFVYSGEAESTAIGTGGGIITGFGGTGVPGLTEHTPTLPQIRPASSMEELLGEFEIPGAKHDEYSQALDNGQTVAGYNAGADIDRVKALFASAGAARVDVF
jgi:hypothetical protein